THTCNFVSRDTWRAREAFLGLTTDPLAGGWGSFLRGRGYFNAEHIYEHTSALDESLPFDWPTFAASASTVRIGAFRCDTGEEVYWGLEDMPTLAHLLPRARASSSMPVLMPMVHIDGVPYMDGAVGPTGGFAIDAAMADGYERMLVVMTRPEGYIKPPVSRPRAYEQLFRRYPELARGVIARAENYNRSVTELEAMQRQGRAYLFRPARMTIANGELRYDRIVSAFEAGLVQARAELPAIEAFLAG
ncbi:patatin-like phospholipase family protein, partial [Actinomyces slackii]